MCVVMKLSRAKVSKQETKLGSIVHSGLEVILHFHSLKTKLEHIRTGREFHKLKQHHTETTCNSSIAKMMLLGTDRCQEPLHDQLKKMKVRTAIISLMSRNLVRTKGSDSDLREIVVGFVMQMRQRISLTLAVSSTKSQSRIDKQVRTSTLGNTKKRIAALKIKQCQS